MNEAGLYVSIGAAWLDAQPLAEGWADRIDTNTVNVIWARECVLGQVFSPSGCCGFCHGEELLEADGGSLETHGFAPSEDASAEDLTEEWTRVILGRRASAEVPS